jgi:hypothetical protein
METPAVTSDNQVKCVKTNDGGKQVLTAEEAYNLAMLKREEYFENTKASFINELNNQIFQAAESGRLEITSELTILDYERMGIRHAENVVFAIDKWLSKNSFTHKCQYKTGFNDISIRTEISWSK